MVEFVHVGGGASRRAGATPLGFCPQRKGSPWRHVCLPLALGAGSGPPLGCVAGSAVGVVPPGAPMPSARGSTRGDVAPVTSTATDPVGRCYSPKVKPAGFGGGLSRAEGSACRRGILFSGRVAQPAVTYPVGVGMGRCCRPVMNSAHARPP